VASGSSLTLDTGFSRTTSFKPRNRKQEQRKDRDS